MIQKIKNWFKKKLTIIFAPGKGSQTYHISLSYPFILSIVLILISIFSAGLYISNLYLSYLHAKDVNQKLVRQKEKYSQKVENTLDMTEKLKEMEIQLSGLLGMKDSRKIVEHSNVGGPGESKDELNLPHKLSPETSLYEDRRFQANVAEVKKETWKKQQELEDVDSFIQKKKDFLLSTPSIWPAFGYITSGYGWRTHPITQRREFHRAVDLYNPLERETPVRATARGKVVMSGWAGARGRTIIIDHGDGFSTRYCHLSKFIVDQKEEVKHGQIIGYMGGTGRSTGPHLHYEVWYKGEPVNPMEYVEGR